MEKNETTLTKRMYPHTEVINQKYHYLAKCVYQLTKARRVMSGCTILSLMEGFTLRRESKIDWQWLLSGVHYFMAEISA